MPIVITVVPSTTYLISGIPKSITITTNVPALIFYTLDGTVATTASQVYVGVITMPTWADSVSLNVLATNGTEQSTFSQRYSPDNTHMRVPHAKAEILNQIPTACGSRGDNPVVLYSQPGDDPVNAYGVPIMDMDGYGASPSVYPVREYDAPIPTYEIKYSETDQFGNYGHGIGTVPAKATIIIPPPAPEIGVMNNPTYDPRSLVTIHDGTKGSEDPNDNWIFHNFFEGEDIDRGFYGADRSKLAFAEGDCAPNGSFLKYWFNPKDDTVTFYYRDNRQNRWIQSIEPVSLAGPALQQSNPLQNYISPNCGTAHVYSWNLYRRSILV